MYDLPSYVWALVGIGVIGIPAATVAMLHRGALAAGLGRRTAAGVTAAVAAAPGGWIVASGLLAGAGVYARGVGLGVVAFGGVLLGLLAASRSPTVARVLAAPGTPARLTWPHTIVAVPLAVALHLVTLRRLGADARALRDRSGHPSPTTV